MLSEFWLNLFPLRTPFPVRKGRWQWQLLGGALGLVIALALHPRFSWLLQEQSRSMFWLTCDASNAVQLPENVSRRALWAAHMKRVGDSLKNDPSGQVAYAVMSVEDTRSIARYWNKEVQSRELGPYGTAALACVKLRDVMQRFPNSALARAAFLRNGLKMVHANAPIRFDTNGTRVNVLGKPIVYGATPQEVVPQSSTDHPPIAPTQQLILDCIQAAKEGEALEPNNAFFPAMQAIVHVSWNQIDEALHDWDRAAQKAEWQEHSEEEVWGRWQLAEKQLGYASSMTRLTISESIPLSYYSYLRAAARFMVVQATEQEGSGHAEAGVALRGRLMRLGALMRDRSQSLPGCLAGAEIIEIAMRNAGGKIHEYSQKEPEAQRRVDPYFNSYDATMQDLYDYTTYLHDNGFNEEARWVDRQVARNMKAMSLSNTDVLLHKIINTQWGWIVGLCLLTQILLFGAIGGMAGVVNYRGRFAFGSPRPLPLAMRYGVGFGTAMAWVAVYIIDRTLISGLSASLDSLWVLGMLLVGLGVAFGILLDGRGTAFLLTAVVTLLGWTVLTLIAEVPAQGIVTLLNQGYLFSVFRGNVGSNPESLRTMLVYCQIWLIPTLVFTIACLIAARSQRIPGLVGIVQGFGKAAVPILALLLLCYCGTTYFNVAMESHYLRAIEEINASEVTVLRQQIDAMRTE